MDIAFAQQYVYGIAPCYGWGRLYMFWFELFETRKDHTTDGNTISVTVYYLQPKYCRQNADGTFGYVIVLSNLISIVIIN